MPDEGKNDLRKHLKTVFKAAFTALLLALLYRKVNGRDFASAVAGMRWLWTLPFFAILFVNTALSALRWRLLLRSDGVDIPLRKLVASYWISSFFNFFLPSNIGGDVYRIADVGRKSGSAAGSLASVFADRLCGFVTLSLAGFLFPLFGLRLIPPENRPLLAIPLVVFLGFLAVAALLWRQGPLRAVLRLLPGAAGKKARAKADEFFASFSAYAARPRTLAVAFAISATFQFLVFVAIWIACRALQIPVSLGECCVFAPFVCLLEAVPLTINGIGLRDSGYALFFSAVGLASRGADPATAAATLSLCYMGLTLAYSCVGGLLFLRRFFSSGGGATPGSEPFAISKSASATVVVVLAALAASANAPAAQRRDLPGFGKDAVYAVAPMPVPGDLELATARAARAAEAADDAAGANHLRKDPAAAEEQDRPEDAFADFLSIARVMVLAKVRHANPVSFREMADGAMDGVMSSLDPNSAFLDEDALEESDADDTGAYDGIGVIFKPECGAFTVAYVFPGSPAFRAGLRMDDKVLAVDGESVADSEPTDILDAMDEKDVLLLEGERAGGGASFSLRLRRTSLVNPSVSAAYMAAPGVGYIRLEQFREDSPLDFLRAFRSLVAIGPVRALVIDLRDNPGGVLDAAAQIAAWFLPADAVVTTTKGRVPEEDDSDMRAMGGGDGHTEIEGPVAILLDSGSASAAELFAAALRDNGRAKIVGSRSFGKASVQRIFEMPEREGAGLSLTTAHYFTPSGEDIHGKGLEPDIRVWQSGDELSAALRARFAAAHPEAATQETRRRLLLAPDRPLEAAVALLMGELAEKAAGKPANKGLDEVL